MWIALGLLIIVGFVVLYKARQGKEPPKGPEPSPITELTVEIEDE